MKIKTGAHVRCLKTHITEISIYLLLSRLQMDSMDFSASQRVISHTRLMSVFRKPSSKAFQFIVISYFKTWMKKQPNRTECLKTIKNRKVRRILRRGICPLVHVCVCSHILFRTLFRPIVQLLEVSAFGLHSLLFVFYDHTQG